MESRAVAAHVAAVIGAFTTAGLLLGSGIGAIVGAFAMAAGSVPTAIDVGDVRFGPCAALPDTLVSADAAERAMAPCVEWIRQVRALAAAAESGP